MKAKQEHTTMNKPKNNTKVIGLTLKEVMPSKAKLIIFFSGYLLSPAMRSFLA